MVNYHVCPGPAAAEGSEGGAGRACGKEKGKKCERIRALSRARLGIGRGIFSVHRGISLRGPPCRLTVTMSMPLLEPKHLIVHIDANHRIGAPLLSPPLQLPQGGLAGVRQLLLVGARTAAEEVAQTGREIPEPSLTPEMTSPNTRCPCTPESVVPSTEGVVVTIIVLLPPYMLCS